MKKLKIAVNVALVCMLVWFLVSHKQKIQAGASQRDSTAYWVAGKLLVHRQNPYSALSYAPGVPIRTPPWSVWMDLPLGLLSVYWAWVAWLAILLASLVISMRISWRMYGDGPRPPNVFLLAGYLFAPVAACLVAGQLGIVLLLGMVLFFLLEEEHPFLAGAALLIPLAKPHIFGSVWAVLGLWIVTRKRWPLLGGMAAAFLIANSIAVAFDPAIFQHYREMLKPQALQHEVVPRIQHEFIPTLSGTIRALFFRRFFWVQFVPTGLGLLWSVWYYWKHQRTWSWRGDGPALLIVAVLTAPYSWITDEAVLLPAILQGVLWVHRAKLRVRSQLVILLFVCLDLLLLLIMRAQVPPATGIYFWSTLVWFSWYWYARGFSQPANEEV
jgi:Glycosyltransferase family 87